MVISTYQAASGAGQAAMDELELQTKEVIEGKPVTKNIFPFQVLQTAVQCCIAQHTYTVQHTSEWLGAGICLIVSGCVACW